MSRDRARVGGGQSLDLRRGVRQAGAGDEDLAPLAGAGIRAHGRLVPERADGTTTSGRPRHEGSSAHGSAWSAPVGTITSSRSPIDASTGASRARSRRSAQSRALAVAAARDAGEPWPKASRWSANRSMSRSPASDASGAERPDGRAAAGERHDVQLAVELHELDERPLAERGRERADGRGAGLDRDAGSRRAADPVPDRLLELSLHAREPARLAAAERRALVLGRGLPEPLQLARELRVVRRPRRPLQQAAGAAALRPREHAQSLAARERRAQAERRELDRVPRDVRPQLARADQRRGARRPRAARRAAPARRRADRRR